ncbi:hypothetical protein Ddye_029005 [Dipteronia dyeriana]|uniref:Uncharacterized protein n=1 Tax=Dipteronia dyeriana TaxID=168575 RepID=A0AAD9TEC8_9ROSI|nr:hypothetical protein Ddye_029005 [Dipteronia dyeriana]
MAHNQLVNMLFDDDSDDEFQLLAIIVIEEEEEMANEGQTSRRRGSILGHAVIQCDRVAAYDLYFFQIRDACRNVGLSSLQKIYVAFRMLSYGVPTDFVNEYVRIDESTVIESLDKFVKAIIAVFRDEYLRSPNNDGITRLLEFNSRCGFPGLLGSIDYMYWKWKNCLIAWQGMYSGHIREPTIILEDVASYVLWICHVFFGLSGSPNDINVQERSTLFNDLIERRDPLINYSINGHEYIMGYYLANCIYPLWSTYVKTIPSPKEIRINFLLHLKSLRGKMLNGNLMCFSHILRCAQIGSFLGSRTLSDIMKACIIMHNMIVEDEREIGHFDFNYDVIEENQHVSVSCERIPKLFEFIRTYHQIRDR